MPYYIKQTISKIETNIEKIKNSIYSTVAVMDTEAWITSEPVAFESRNTGKRMNIAIGDKWGDLWDCAWFNFKGEVPLNAKDKKIVLLIDLSGEGCVFDSKGCPIRGLTNVSSSFEYSLGMPGKRVYQFIDKAKGQEKVDIWVEAGCNDLFGAYKDNGTLKEANIAICNEEMRQLYYDFYVLYNLSKNISEKSARYQSIIFKLNEAVNIMNNYTEEEAIKARKILKTELDKKGGDPSLTLSAIGHAHIDLAWLWPIRETIRKGARTFSTVIDLMDRYPDYVFGASQPQLYQWIKERYPLLYEKIKVKIAEGRWEAQGAMWVEADTNIAGGEALVRQVLYGKRFFRNEFNKDMKILWLPDVFGYSAALPQILKKSGVDYFMTIKLSWSEHNIFPHHTFFWQGIDGSRILSHMPPEGTYNSPANPEFIKKAEENFIDKGLSDSALVLFGIGDGGGGPGPEHLERLKREKNIDGLVPVEQGKAIDFFKKIEKQSERYKTWCGELYLEKHQGTYTTQARNKWYNRKIEIGLRELEFACVMANSYGDYPYPSEKIESIWKEVLLYQFHDILPGSSIKRVYDEAIARYSELYKEVQSLTVDAYEFISNMVCTNNMKKPFILFNSLSWNRNEWIKLDNKWLEVSIPSMGYIVIDGEEETKNVYSQFVTRNCIENDIIKVAFNDDGTIKTVYDKSNKREVLSEGCSGNVLSVYKDNGDAWDFPINYDEIIPDKFELVAMESYMDGPKIMMKQNYKYGNSTLEQEIVITQGSSKIDFNTSVEWNESNKMLRTSFPVNVFTNNVTCNIQFGNIKRPVNDNTSWDMAKYEICAHKWIDLSNKDFGVALLNDCKYGHKVKGNVMDINLLRSTQFPGETADKGHHVFTYSLYSHAGDEIEGNVDNEAYELNIPTNVFGLSKTSNETEIKKSFIEVSKKNVIIESVKKAEDDDAYIIRLYENCGYSAETEIKFGFLLNYVELVDIMEENGHKIELSNNKVKLLFKPFEIHTLKVYKK